MPHTDDRNYPIYDTITRLTPKCGNICIYGMASITDANIGNEPGRYTEEVDLGVNFNSQPVVQLTNKNFHDDDGNVYSTGKHEFSYRWLDADHFSKFEIISDTSVINYPPSVAYTVTGRLGFLQRFFYCRSR